MKLTTALALSSAFIGICAQAVEAPAAAGAAANGVRTEKAGEGWQAPLYKAAANPEKWAELEKELLEKHFYYGATSAALRSLQYFGDVDSKQAAYEVLVSLLDQGLPIHIREAFNPGDIEPMGEPAFTNSYFLYKSILNANRGLKRWSEFYRKKVTDDDFTKALFFQALESYEQKKFPEAKTALTKILAQNEKKPLHPGFLKKITRTLARIYFEEENYAASLDIYTRFLLRMNPTTSLDWLEAAWNAYYMNRHKEAIGYLYNLESLTFSDWGYFERYLLLALIYKDFCNTQLLESLAARFKVEYGATLTGIKNGEPLRKLPKLLEIYPKGSSEYLADKEILRGLEAEFQELSKLSGTFEAPAKILYQSEIAFQKRQAEIHLDHALDQAARQVVMLYESLRFLGFDIAREKFNPDVIFQKEKKVTANASLLVKRNPKAESYTLAWRQYGDYWADERLLYRGNIVNLCLEER